MKTKLPFYLFILLIAVTPMSISAQNLLDTSNWAANNDGQISGFNKHGSAQENERVFGTDHLNNQVVLWQASPSGDANSDGGWTTSYHAIDPTKKYRFTVWLKKTNSMDGVSSFGCLSYKVNDFAFFEGIENLDGTSNPDPLFWSGDLPKLNKWYLLVGFVHGSGGIGGPVYSITSRPESSGVYDGTTGSRVGTVTNFKFTGEVNKVLHRALLENDGNIEDHQFFYAPRIDLVDGTEPTIEELMSLHENPQLTFGYDNAKNQTLRVFSNITRQPRPLVGIKNSIPINSTIEEQQDEPGKVHKNTLENNPMDPFGKIVAYPNPTKQLVHIQIAGKYIKSVEAILVFDINGKLLKRISRAKKSAHFIINFSGFPSGVYFINIQLSHGAPISKKVIKE